MNIQQSSDQNINALDLRIDFRKRKLSQIKNDYDKNHKTTLTLDEINSAIEDTKSLERELQSNLQSYTNYIKPKLEKQNQEKKQANNQKLKKQTLNNPVQPILPQNPPNPVQHVNPPVSKDRPPQRNQRDSMNYFPSNPRSDNKHSNSSQSQNRHHDKKNVSKSTDNDKPLRIPTDKGNKNGVWYKSEPFFQKIPKTEDYAKMFSIIDTISQNRRIQASEQSEGVVCHYSERLNRLVHKKSMKEVPSPPPDVNDISDFWKDNQLSFQIETMQKRRFSCFHYLINSFVEIDAPQASSPISSPSQSGGAIKTSEIGTAKSEKNRESNPIASFALLPQIVSETYMALSFDQRLALELESLGLNQPPGTQTKRISQIEKEIEEKTKESEQTIASLNEIREFVMSNLDRFRDLQMKRNKSIEESQALLIKKAAEKKQMNK